VAEFVLALTLMKTLASFLLLLASAPFTWGAIEQVAGEPKTAAVSEPFSVDFDAKGAMYGVEFTKSNRIFKLADGKLEFIAGVQHSVNEKVKKEATDVGDGSDPQKAVFNGMHDIQITSDGKAILGDSFHHRVRLLDLGTGHVSTLGGTGKAGFGGDGGPATEAMFNVTMTASLSQDQKRIYVADIGNHRVRMFDLAGGKIETVAGNGQKGNPADGGAALESPLGDARAVVQAKDGTLYVLLRGGNSLVEVKNGKVRTIVNASGKKGYSGDGGPGRDATMNGPKYLAFDASGNVLICDTENNCVRRWSPATEEIDLIAGKPPKKGTAIGNTWLETDLSRPHGVRLGPDGKLYVADTYNNRVLRGEYR
jgi:DNA-binding beta-propeller fold protein YncE